MYPFYSLDRSQTHAIKISIADGWWLQNLPFKKGDEVEIIILDRNPSKIDSNSFPLRGTVISYDDPFEPATSGEDWEVLNRK